MVSLLYVHGIWLAKILPWILARIPWLRTLGTLLRLLLLVTISSVCCSQGHQISVNLFHLWLLLLPYRLVRLLIYCRLSFVSSGRRQFVSEHFSIPEYIALPD